MENKENDKTERRPASLAERINAGTINLIGGITSGLAPFLYIRIVQAKRQRKDYEEDFVYLNARQSFMMQLALNCFAGILVILVCAGIECFYGGGVITKITTATGDKYLYPLILLRTAVMLLTFVGVGSALLGHVFEYPFIEGVFRKTNILNHVDGRREEENTDNDDK